MPEKARQLCTFMDLIFMKSNEKPRCSCEITTPSKSTPHSILQTNSNTYIHSYYSAHDKIRIYSSKTIGACGVRIHSTLRCGLLWNEHRHTFTGPSSNELKRTNLAKLDSVSGVLFSFVILFCYKCYVCATGSDAWNEERLGCGRP